MERILRIFSRCNRPEYRRFLQGGKIMSKKWVYLFTEGNASMRDLLGGKGAGVAEMTRTGVPVPPGFTITTEACNEYYARGKQFPEDYGSRPSKH